MQGVSPPLQYNTQDNIMRGVPPTYALQYNTKDNIMQGVSYGL